MKLNYRTVALLLVFPLLLSSAVLGFAKLTTIKSDEAYELIQKRNGDSDFVILDVRTPDEYASGHIEGAINIDFYENSFKDELDQLDKRVTYLIYCRTGGRSGKTLAMMKGIGFRNVYDLQGGITKWRRDYPVVR
jgi:rhodanese-related sulfurtransferase